MKQGFVSLMSAASTSAEADLTFDWYKGRGGHDFDAAKARTPSFEKEPALDWGRVYDETCGGAAQEELKEEVRDTSPRSYKDGATLVLLVALKYNLPCNSLCLS